MYDCTRKQRSAQTPPATLAIWGAAGCVLAVVATVAGNGLPKFGHRAPRSVPLNYRASYDHFAG